MKKADGPPRPGFDKLLRGCEAWRAELTEHLQRGGHEYYGTGARTRRGRRRIPPPLTANARGSWAAIRAALRKAKMVAR